MLFEADAEFLAEAESGVSGSGKNGSGKSKYFVGPLVGSSIRESREHSIPSDLGNDQGRNAESMGARAVNNGHEPQHFQKEDVVLVRQIQQCLGLDLSKGAQQAQRHAISGCRACLLRRLARRHVRP